MEVWKDINKNYEVSNYGSVRSKDRVIVYKNGKVVNRKGKALKPQPISNGYLAVYFSENGKQKWYYVHRLVAEAFIPNPNNLPQVNHKDENKLNNFVENLEWCTAKYNANYGTRNSRALEANIKTGRYSDLRGLSEEEIKDLRRKKTRDRYTKKNDNRVVIYEVGDKFIRIGEFKNFAQAAKYIGASKPTIKQRVLNGNNKPLFGKYYIEKAI